MLFIFPILYLCNNSIFIFSSIFVPIARIPTRNRTRRNHRIRRFSDSKPSYIVGCKAICVTSNTNIKVDILWCLCRSIRSISTNCNKIINSDFLIIYLILIRYYSWFFWICWLFSFNFYLLFIFYFIICDFVSIFCYKSNKLCAFGNLPISLFSTFSIIRQLNCLILLYPFVYSYVLVGLILKRLPIR